MSCESEKLFQLANLLDARNLNNPGLLRQYAHQHNTRCDHSAPIAKPKYDISPALTKSGYDKALNADYMSRPVRLYSALSSAIKYLTPTAKTSLSGMQPQRESQTLETKFSEDEFEAMLEARIRSARQETMQKEEQQWMQ